MIWSYQKKGQTALYYQISCLLNGQDQTIYVTVIKIELTLLRTTVHFWNQSTCLCYLVLGCSDLSETLFPHLYFDHIV